MHYLMHIFKRRISHEYSSCSCASLEPMALHTRMARRQDEMGHWFKLAWQLVVPSHAPPTEAFSPACVQAECQAAFHSIAQGVKLVGLLLDFLPVQGQAHLHAPGLSHSRDSLCSVSQLGKSLVSKPDTWSSRQLTSSLHWAVQPLNHSSKQLNWAGA